MFFLLICFFYEIFVKIIKNMTENKDLVLGQDNFLRNIPDLQYKIKKQPELFVKEVVKCIEKFKEQYTKVIESPAQKNESFIEISLLLAHVV